MMIDEFGVGEKDSPMNLLEVGSLLSEMMRHMQQQVGERGGNASACVRARTRTRAGVHTHTHTHTHTTTHAHVHTPNAAAGAWGCC